MLRSPVRTSSLAKQVEDILDERILAGFYPPKSQLPAEDELAREFNVSRATVRSALSSLTAMGKLVRLHGVGTFVSQLPRMSNPLDQLIDFQELFLRYGHESRIEFIQCDLQIASNEMESALNLSQGSQVIRSEKIFTAGSAPSIYCVNTIPAELFRGEWLEKVLNDASILEPLFIFLEDQFHLRVAYMHSRVYALNASQISFHRALPFKRSTPVLVLDEVAYTDEGRPIFHTFEYHPERRMSFELIRRRVNT